MRDYSLNKYSENTGGERYTILIYQKITNIQWSRCGRCQVDKWGEAIFTQEEGTRFTNSQTKQALALVMLGKVGC